MSMLDFALGQCVKRVGVPDCQVQLFKGGKGWDSAESRSYILFQNLKGIPYILYLYIYR